MTIRALLRSLFGRRAPAFRVTTDGALLNYSLELAQEWGEEWLQPIQGRLHNKYPNLSQSELDELNAVARAAMMFAYDCVRELVEGHGSAFDKSMLERVVRLRYPWVGAKNLSHLYSTGIYYAHK